MNKLITSTSLAFVGIASVQAQSVYNPAPDLSPREQAKPWSVSATLKGFYDSNALQTPDDAATSEIDSWGLIFGAGAGLDLALEQTYFAVAYDYTFVNYWESDLEDNHNHAFNFRFNQAFSEDLELSVTDYLVISDEPSVIDGGTPVKTESSALRNTGNVDLLYSISEEFGVGLGYSNTYYDYDDPTFSTILDRIEQTFGIDGRFMSRPDLTWIAGYEFKTINYQSDNPLPGTGAPADARDRQSHYVFGGADYNMSDELTLSGRAGANFADYPNVPSGSTVDDSSVSPYVDISGTWAYNEGSYVRSGLRYDNVATDVVTSLDSEAITWYGLWSHTFTANLIGNLNWQTQFGELNEGPTDGDSENLYSVGLGLDYLINQNLTAMVGYKYMDLDSDLDNRSFDRHRISFGITASY